MNPRPLSTRLIYSPLPPCFNSRISFYVRGQLSKGSPSKIASIPEATSSGSRSVADLAVVGENENGKSISILLPPVRMAANRRYSRHADPRGFGKPRLYSVWPPTFLRSHLETGIPRIRLKPRAVTALIYDYPFLIRNRATIR